MQGPEILWGSEGVPLGYDESEIKGYDNFGRFCAAIEANGLVEELQSGEYTLLVPSDSAFDEHESEGRGAVTAPWAADILARLALGEPIPLSLDYWQRLRPSRP